MATVILGTGIIGTSIAYYLSQTQSPSTIHLVEPSPTLFSSASGYAGGFLAKDWFSPSATALGALSFDEHKRLADEHGGHKKWGYLHTTTWSYTAANAKGKDENTKRGDYWLRQGTSRANAAVQRPSGSVNEQTPMWLSRAEGDDAEVISEQDSTAQVNPLKLCQFLLSQCLERGVQLHHPAKAISVGKDMRDELASVRIASPVSDSESDIPCTHVVIAAGAWSPQVFATLFPDAKLKLPVTSLAGHSLVVRSPRWKKEHEELGCHAIYTTDDSGYCPEIFSRVGGEIYIAGMNDASLPLPELATECKIDNSVIEKLQATAKRLLCLPDGANDVEILRKGLCFRPVTDRGTPIISRIVDEKLGDMKTRAGKDGGVFLATGHGPWGISMSLGTGKVMAEIVQGQPTSVHVKALELDP